MKRPFLSGVYLLVLLTGLCLSPRPARADGMLIDLGPYADRFDYAKERDQQVFIRYDSGREKMLVSIGIDQQSSAGKVWLFPLPASPEKVTADITTDTPYLYGSEITKTALSNFEATKRDLWATQVYPSFFHILNTAQVGTALSDGRTLGTADGLSDSQYTVEVYDQLIKDGMTTQIISAKTATGLVNYLQAKGLQITSDALPMLNSYLGHNYSFVVSWISAAPTSNDSESIGRGVYVTFPTDRIYFPLVPTSVYGSRTVPASIRVIGHVTPQLYSDIQPFTTTEYFVDSSAVIDTDFTTTYNPGHTLAYTKITIAAPSKLLTDDLWIDPVTPASVTRIVALITHQTLIFWILLLVASWLAGIIAGLISFPALRHRLLKLGWLGLANCLTVYGLIVATNLTQTQPTNEGFAPILLSLKERGYQRRRRLATVLFMVAIPLLLLGLLSLPSLLASLHYATSSTAFNDFLPGMALLYVLPIIMIVGGRFAKRVRPEDIPLFDQLRWARYSTWTLRPKDPAKLLFVPVYSVTFVLLSWLAVLLLQRLV